MTPSDATASVHVNDKKTDDERFFRLTGVGRGRSGWYFRAREGIFGPYGSLVDAHQELRDLIGMRPDRQIERLRRLGLDLNRT